MAAEDRKEEVSIVVKLLIDTKANRVLFAEAGKDFVDFLFHIFSLSIGSVVNILTTKGMVGCVGELFNSIESLNTQYFQPNVTKDSILKPLLNSTTTTAVRVPLLLPTNNSPVPKKMYFYGCPNKVYSYGGCRNYVSDGQGARCPECHGRMSSALTYIVPSKEESATGSNTSSGSEGGYVKEVLTYMVMDNLEVKPLSTISGITLINKFNVKDIASLVEKEVQVGPPQGVALLKASLDTKTVLTTVFL